MLKLSLPKKKKGVMRRYTCVHREVDQRLSWEGCAATRGKGARCEQPAATNGQRPLVPRNRRNASEEHTAALRSHAHRTTPLT